MKAIEYTKKLRWLATFSWVGSLIIFLGLAKLHIIPSNEALPFLALLVGALPIAAFMLKNKAIWLLDVASGIGQDSRFAIQSCEKPASPRAKAPPEAWALGCRPIAFANFRSA